jgi:hypothetical protein
MKMIVSALIALSLLTSIAAPASALDAKEFWQQQDAITTERSAPAGPAGQSRGSCRTPASTRTQKSQPQFDVTDHGELP